VVTTSNSGARRVVNMSVSFSMFNDQCSVFNEIAAVNIEH